MKNTTLLFAATFVLTQGLFAEYPRDAAERFKLKYGINHPVVEQEARAAREAKEAKLKQTQARPEPKGSKGTAAQSDSDREPSDSSGR
ncbi:MAG TPA: hypothetical protein VK493_03345 [Bryobacteraceae bacterium]|nr:hypothetical protein [Bryobacteraceae bacterium]